MTAADAAALPIGPTSEAIHAIGKPRARGRGVYAGPGISVKLSALHPRYSRAQHGARHGRAAAPAQEPAGRSRKPLQYRAQHRRRGSGPPRTVARSHRSPGARSRTSPSWNGVGIVVQAYQKRCPFVLDFLIDLARRSRAPLHGAPGQGRLLGQRDQARSGRRAGRLSGLHAQGLHRRRVPRLCEEAAGGAGRDLPAVRHAQRLLPGGGARAGPGQGLRVPVPARHGRDAVRRGGRAGEAWTGPCRVYAPVGTHETLLAYLVRRLLENGANSSFVNRLVDPAVSIDELVADQVEARGTAGWAPLRPDPAAAGELYGACPPQLQGRRPFERGSTCSWLQQGLEASTPRGRLDRLSDPRQRRSGDDADGRADPQSGRSRDDRRRHGARGRTRRMSMSRSALRQAAAPGWAATEVENASRLPGAHGRPARGGDAGADRARDPRGRQVGPQRRGRGARGRGFLPLLRVTDPRRVQERHAPRVGSGRLHRALGTFR